MIQPPRTVINALAYVVFALTLAAAPLMPHFLPIAPFAYAIALFAQRGRPNLVVFRRFGPLGTDLSLTERILRQVAGYTRTIWLEDCSRDHPLLRVKRHSVLALTFHLCGGIAM